MEKDTNTLLGLAVDSASAGSQWQLDTRIKYDTGHIAQDLTSPSGVVTTWIADTREKSFRDGLMKLGWTPPKPKTENERNNHE